MLAQIRALGACLGAWLPDGLSRKGRPSRGQLTASLFNDTAYHEVAIWLQEAGKHGEKEVMSLLGMADEAD